MSVVNYQSIDTARNEYSYIGYCGGISIKVLCNSFYFRFARYYYRAYN